jgi:uncharacterized membrane protein
MNIWGRGFVALAIGWAVLLPVATFAASPHAGGASHTASALAFVVYQAGRLICHQRPERSFHLFATALPVCARCTGIYAGAALMAAATAIRPSLASLLMRAGARRVLLVSVLPAAATLVAEWITGTMPPHWIRAVSGALIGAAVAVIVCRAAAAPRGGM